MNNLELYAKQENIVKEAQACMAELKALIEADVKANGNQTGGGKLAKMKPGRKKTDHKMAAFAAGVGDDLVAKHTTTKTTITTKWGAVTKESGCDVSAFTTQAEPALVIEDAK